MTINQNNFYVYLHKRKDTNEVFYIGKGRNKRAYSKSGRSKDWQSIVNHYGYSIELYKDNLSEDTAFSIEKSLIAQYGLDNLTNKTYGGEGKIKDPVWESFKVKLDELSLIIYLKNNLHLIKKDKWISDHLILLNTLYEYNKELKLYADKY